MKYLLLMLLLSLGAGAQTVRCGQGDTAVNVCTGYRTQSQIYPSIPTSSGSDRTRSSLEDRIEALAKRVEKLENDKADQSHLKPRHWSVDEQQVSKPDSLNFFYKGDWYWYAVYDVSLDGCIINADTHIVAGPDCVVSSSRHKPQATHLEDFVACRVEGSSLICDLKPSAKMSDVMKWVYGFE